MLTLGMETNNILHPIGYVARRTGLTTHVIRVWEHRYSAIEPTRTDTNRRLYTDSDIERLSLLKAATVAGHSISSVASISNDSLKSIVRADESVVIEQSPNLVDPASELEDYLKRCQDSVPDMNRTLLENTLRDASVALSMPYFLEKLVVPFMRWIGDEWHEGRIRVVHEQFASVVIRDILYRLGIQECDSSLPAVIVCTPAGNAHENGALLVANAAALEGWRVVYLGANTPLHEISVVAKKQQARAVGLSATYMEDPGRLVAELSHLRQMLPDSCPIFIGGSAAGQRYEDLEKTGVQYVSDLQAFRAGLRDTLETYNLT
jgi:DNA-binding transcriptional MerR regulator/methylmalonyl-CoA mutase cobalamin-binding subunit